MSKGSINVTWIIGDNHGEYGYQVNIPWHRWTIVITVDDEDADDKYKGIEDIYIYDENGVDVTEDHLMFKDRPTIRPTGVNLWQIMDLLTTIRKQEEK